MDLGDVLRLLCKEYENFINADKKEIPIKVKFVNEKKPDGYWLSQMHMGTSKTANIDRNSLAWHTEIWVNNKCIYRQNVLPSDQTEEGWNKAKFICQQKVLTAVFTYGLAAAREILKNTKHEMN